MHFSPEVLQQLEAVGLVASASPAAEPATAVPTPARRAFQPSGLNDKTRVDLTAAPFWAIDCAQPEEIDDAIRVRHNRLGGFTVEVAIADAGQLNGSLELLNRAVELKHSRYRQRPGRSLRLFPNDVLDSLELNSDRVRRALVVRRQFDGDMQPKSDVELIPATVKTRRLTMFGLGRAFVNHDRHVSSLAKAADAMGVHISRPKTGDRGTHFWRIGSATVARFMVQTNLSIDEWSTVREVPILHLASQQRLEAGKPTPTYFTRQPDTHDHIIRGQTVLYTQGTSPLRRVNDTITMISAAEYISGRRTGFTFGPERLDEIAQHLSSVALPGLESR